MPPKSKTSKEPKEKEMEVADTPTTGEEDAKTSESDAKEQDVGAVPSWRAEVVEEGAEKSDAKPQEKKESASEEKPLSDDEKVTDLTGEVPGQTSEPTEPTQSSWVEGSSPIPPPGSSVNISLSKKLFWLFIFLLIAGIVVGGFFFYKSKVDQGPAGETSQIPTSAPAQEPTATPTPAEEVELETLRVNILNGSGIPGEAGSVQSLLEEAGFSDFETGNADSYDYTITEVTLKPGVSEAVFEAVKEALGDYNVVLQEGNLDEDSEFDVEIIVGTKTASSSPTISP